MDRGDQLAPTTRNTYSSTGKRSKKIRVRRRKRGSRAVEIADADRAIIRVIDTIYAFLRLVSQISSGFPLAFFEIKEEGRRCIVT